MRKALFMSYSMAKMVLELPLPASSDLFQRETWRLASMKILQNSNAHGCAGRRLSAGACGQRG